MNQFFYLPPVTKTIVAKFLDAGFTYSGIEEEWDEDFPLCSGFRIVVENWWEDFYGERESQLRAIWEETGDAWEIELSKLDKRERRNVALEKIIDLIQLAERSHRISPGQLRLFEEVGS